MLLICVAALNSIRSRLSVLSRIIPRYDAPLLSSGTTSPRRIPSKRCRQTGYNQTILRTMRSKTKRLGPAGPSEPWYSLIGNNTRFAYTLVCIQAHDQPFGIDPDPAALGAQPVDQVVFTKIDRRRRLSQQGGH